MSSPWHPDLPIWEWPGVTPELAARCREHYEERAAIMEYDACIGRVSAEQNAYALMIEMLYDRGVFSTEEISDHEVITQVRRAAIIRRSWSFGDKLVSRGGPGSARPREFQ